VTRFVPEFAAAGKDSITLFHLLTHTAGFRGADNTPRHIPWDEAAHKVCEAPLERDWTPGQKAGYSTQASWVVLAEMIARVTGKPFLDYLRGELLSPLAMNDTWLSLPIQQFEHYGTRIAQMFDTFAGKKAVSAMQDAPG